MCCYASLFAENQAESGSPGWYSLGGPLCLLFVLYLPSLIALSQLRGRRLEDTAMAVWALCIVLVPLLGSIAFWVVRPEPLGRLDQLAKALYQFRGDLHDVVGAQRDAVQAARERTEEEAAQALIRKDRPG